jgi:nucleoside-diphosphate-sugar epimerase
MTVRVAITGATGFAGRHVAAALAAKGYAVRALVRDEVKAERIKFAEPVIGTLADHGALDRLLSGADVLVHLAGAIAAADRNDFLRTNREGTRKVADAAMMAEVKRIIHVSSLAAREPQLSDYAMSKSAGETVMSEHANRFSLAILRPPAIYGPGDRATLPLFAQLTRRFALVPGTRAQRFSLIYAGDFARLIVNLAGSNWSGLAEVHDGKSGGYDWADLVSTATAIHGRPVTPVFVPRRLLAGLATFIRNPGIPPHGKIRELYHPDWVCRGPQPDLPDRTGLAEGFRQTLHWYREEGWLPIGGGADGRRPPHRQKVLAA